MYDKLFDVLQANYNLPVTPKMMEDMGMKLVEGALNIPNVWWTNSYQSGYIVINLSGNESIFDVVKSIINEDAAAYETEVAEERAGIDI